MATYNGAKYIDEQINSIINQTLDDWTLIISDDNSSDGTVSILKKYEKSDSRIKVITSETNIGVVRNFEKLMNYAADYSYVMFCDQDDVWLNTKIETTYKAMKELEDAFPDEPVLVYCEKTEVDESLNKIITKNRKYSDTLSGLLAQNHIYGCTVMINHSLLNISKNIPYYIENHDYWLALQASLFGRIKNIPSSLILYRQHSNNITGGISNHNLVSKIKKWSMINKYQKKTIEQNYLFCKENEYINNEDIDNYLRMLSLKGLNRIMYALKIHLVRDSFLSTCRFYLNILNYENSKL